MNKIKIMRTKVFSALISIYFCFINLLVSPVRAANPHSLDFSNFGKTETEITSSQLQIKIKISSDAVSFLIGVAKDGYVKDADHKYWLYPLTKYQVKLNSKGSYDLIMLKKANTKTIGILNPPISISAYNTSIFFNDHWYRGNIDINNSITGLTAINSLPIEPALMGILGPLVQEDDSDQAIKASIVIVRSSLASLSLTASKEDYQLIASNLAYKGIDGEKTFVNQMIKQLDGEVLFNRSGELIYTPLRSAITESSPPFELIGKQSRAWEKVIKLFEAEQMLQKANYSIGQIKSLQSAPIANNKQALPGEGSSVFIVGSAGSAQINKLQAQKIFGLPSQFFRVYFFNDQDGEPNLQFIGSLLNAPGSPAPDQAVFNLVRLIHETTDPYWTYPQILKDIYPGSYLGKI